VSGEQGLIDSRDHPSLRVARARGSANVRLDRDLFSGPDVYKPFWLWRVSIRALKAIAPLGEIVREAPHEEQYRIMYNSDICIETRGFDTNLRRYHYQNVGLSKVS
jgi:hypothetical protein